MSTTPITKTELLAQLSNAKNNYLLGLAAISLFSDPAAWTLLDQKHASFGTYSMPFSQVATLLRDTSDRQLAIREFSLAQIRGLVKESFELLKNYTEETNQEALLNAESWYHFARMIRNCLSHNFKFCFNKHDKTKLPQTWNGKTISLVLEEQPLELAFFGFPQTWELFREFEDFAKNRLV